MPHVYQHSYLCREKFNSTTLRIRLHLKANDTEYEPNVFVFYRFTMRTIDLAEEDKLTLDDRFERPITDLTSIDFRRRENHTVSIHHLYPGRYEICVNFFNKKKTIFYRSANSCLHVPWYVPEYELSKPNLLIQVSLLISVILLLASITFVGYAIHQYIQAEERPVVTAEDEASEQEEQSDSERVRFLVNQYFGQSSPQYSSLIKKRLRQRYAHRSPDLSER